MAKTATKKPTHKGFVFFVDYDEEDDPYQQHQTPPFVSLCEALALRMLVFKIHYSPKQCRLFILN